MDGSLFIMEGSLLSRFLLLQLIVALSLWKLVCCRDYFDTTMNCSLVIMKGSLLFISFVTPMDGSLIIMEGSLLSISLLLQCILALSLWKVVYCRGYFDTTMDCSLVSMEGSLLSISLLLQWMVALSLWKVVCCPDFYTLRDGSFVIIEGSILSRFFLL